MTIQTLDSWDTEYSADTVEWCPTSGCLDILAVGTYQVDQSAQETFSGSQRRGRIYIHQLEDHKLVLKSQLETAAILDMRWHPRSESSLLAVVDALGFVTLFELDDSLALVVLHKLPVTKDEALALSLEWNCRKDGTRAEDLIAISDSKGSISIARVNSNRSLELIESRKSHDYEAWICAFNAWDSNVFYSGGDDAVLLGHDIRSPEPIFKCREHGAGVTSLLSDLHREHCLLSGSYDESIYTWDSRNMKQSRDSLNLGGGVWRIKQKATLADIYVTACMSNGFALVQQIESQLKVLDRYEEHTSLAYGVDFQVGPTSADLLATCSFYDHSLKLWTWKKS
ncbi:hypothetical protein TCAL_06933 [Tigriopus californicus]|uniref:methylated diphthine methylhydrolase n=2 Tax=Tigriopus californicus TaxID=6832 RepID=A0A553NT33_TIGCA|nr:diphthine methyltransferase-like isoform X2 [Tigriopus californicus]TRY68594.1 hypothetical protein TCAL_06933 [Tigriopus californicus]|eukprot:TCALIF_06933-PA protein Name:"Similar to DPH7 Diphthamide biosynthesis protein 7 (Homo sapiens)" AED:0.02 eAED:0.02 QI:1339/1/1/1/1/1/2/1371/339